MKTNVTLEQALAKASKRLQEKMMYLTMNENIDLTKILKDCPKGTKLYSSVFGDVEFVRVYQNNSVDFIIEIKLSDNSIDSVTTDGRLYEGFNGECILFPSKEQRDWSKFKATWLKKKKLVKPKFKVGDRIRHKETNKDDVYVISKVYDDSYGVAGFTWMIYMKYQDQYELVPNKFDPETLAPFDKVIVRDTRDRPWICAVFSNVRKEDENITFKYQTTGGAYVYCIPYNDDTKHLVGTTDEPSDYYRYWED